MDSENGHAADSAPSSSKTSKSSNKDRSSAQLCDEMGITNIELNYTNEDYQNLVTYKLFNQHIRPLLLEKNPKLVMYKMVSVIGAKWREFIELKEQYLQQREKEKEKDKDKDKEPTIQSLQESTQDTGNGKRPGRAAKKRTIDYSDQNASNGNQVDTDLNQTDLMDQQADRRTSSRNKKTSAKMKQSNQDVSNDDYDDNKSPSSSSNKEQAAASKRAAQSNSKQPSKKKRRRGDGGEGGGGSNNADSDAEFEAMLEEQCRIEENEKEKRSNDKPQRKPNKTFNISSNYKSSSSSNSKTRRSGHQTSPK